MTKETLTTAQFFQTHPIFTIEDFKKYSEQAGKSTNPKTRENALRQFQKRGAISQIRRGIYCTVPPGSSPSTCPVDGYVLASKLAADAALAYHAALELHGRSYSVRNEFTYLTRRYPSGRMFTYRGMRFKAIEPPAPLLRTQQPEFGITTLDRMGQSVRVTTLERTLVDVLDRPKLSGGWEEVWRSLETVPYFDLDKVVNYAVLLKKRKTIALVGLYLEQHAKELTADETYLSILEKHRPTQPQYVDSSSGKTARIRVSRWNLFVPESIVRRSWEELA
jgi:predicted transcriptional regulator of viral defense system